MKKTITTSLTILLLINTLAVIHTVKGENNFETVDQINQYQNGHRYNIQGWVYIHIEGEAYDRGYQYGYLATGEIQDMIDRCRNFGHDVEFMKLFIFKNLPNNYEKLSKQWWDICKSRSESKFWKNYPEELKQEIKGIADGVNANSETKIDFRDILALNEFQNVWWSIKYWRNSIHPFRGFFYGLRNILLGNTDEFKPLSCSAFIATGDATENGGLLIGHSTHFNMYIAERCNIILDVQPTNGYRFLMTCFPGAIWSNEDYYQNEKGIILMETALPQGPWKKQGKTIGLRARKAIQYSDSIDEVIHNLKSNNNGLIPDEWLIGDAKTNEIASIELALFNTPVKRTYNGFYWSCNVPHDEKVRKELYGAIDLIPMLSEKVYDFYAYGRDDKFKELEKKYYGKLNSEIAKEILSTDPICRFMSDGKITTTDLMDDMGLLAFMGNPNGLELKPSAAEKEKFHGITDLPASGWVKLFPSNNKPNNRYSQNKMNQPKKTCRILWEYETDYIDTSIYGSSSASDDIVYTSLDRGNLVSINTNRVESKWEKNVEDGSAKHTVSEEHVFIGANMGLYAIDKEYGTIEWSQPIGTITDKPVIAGDVVITSCSNGDLYAFDIKTGSFQWKYNFPGSPYITKIDQNILCVGSDDKCYSFDIKNKEILWKINTNGKITATPTLKEENVYFGSWDGFLYSVDTKTGNLKWKFETGWGIDTTPAISDNIVYVGSNDNNFYAIDDKTGEMIWYYTCNSGIHSSPVVYGEYVFFGSDDGRLYAVDKINGELVWTFAPEYYLDAGEVNNYITTPILSDPFVDNGVVYISVKGVIYALDSQTFEKTSVGNKPKQGIFDNLTSIILVFILIILLTLVIYKLYIKKKRM